MVTFTILAQNTIGYQILTPHRRFKLKFMVQQRQWRHQHIDSHYAAACFRYLKEYAISVRPYCCFVSFDDKHKVKVGEPGYPVAAAERGRRVLVREDEYLTVGDHDFTKFSLIPSVIFVIDVPEEISGSWFTGMVIEEDCIICITSNIGPFERTQKK